MATVVDYWRDGYDWRRQEAALNALPHFRTNVAGLDLHFVHAKPAAGSTADKKVPTGLWNRSARSGWNEPQRVRFPQSYS